jgi:hypothetical protein
MKIQDLDCNNSSFIELDLNEAADVCGGYLSVPDSQPGGISNVAFGAFQSNINRFGVSNYPGFGQVTLTRSGLYRSIDYPEYGLFKLS